MTTQTVRSGEQFTALTDCPACGHLAVHWLTKPKFAPPETPAETVHRIMAWGGHVVRGPDLPRSDPPGTVVARVCVECGYRWGQR